MFKVASKIISEKKNRYIIQSLLVAIFVYVTTQGILDIDLISLLVLSIILVSSGVLVSHYPGINKNNFLISIIMPLGVLSGALLSLSYYPNLGSTFKLLVIGFFGVLYYLVSLADNVFLVVHDREEIIPLFRVAVTWSQILQVVVAIPIFAGVFKLDTQVFSQSLIVALISSLFCYYQLWIYGFEPDAKKTGVGEKIYLCCVSFFILYTSSMAVSFFPSEDFLRALFVSSVLLFVLNYISAHLKNEISRKMIFGYLAIVVTFLLSVIFFRP